MQQSKAEKQAKREAKTEAETEDFNMISHACNQSLPQEAHSEAKTIAATYTRLQSNSGLDQDLTSRLVHEQKNDARLLQLFSKV